VDVPALLVEVTRA
jgi:hypothetical protein